MAVSTFLPITLYTCITAPVSLSFEKLFDEGPSIANAKPLNAQGFNEGSSKNFTAEDFRFTKKGNVLYATFFGWPNNKQVLVKSLNTGSLQLADNTQANVSLLRHSGKVGWKQTAEGLMVQLPDTKPCENAYVLKISGITG